MNSFLELLYDLFHSSRDSFRKEHDPAKFRKNRDLFINYSRLLRLTTACVDRDGDSDGYREDAAYFLDGMKNSWLAAFNAVQPLIGYTKEESGYPQHWRRWTENSFNLYSLYHEAARISKESGYFSNNGWREVNMLSDISESLSKPLLDEFYEIIE